VRLTAEFTESAEKRISRVAMPGFEKMVAQEVSEYL
jgi:hypothetical protein